MKSLMPPSALMARSLTLPRSYICCNCLSQLRSPLRRRKSFHYSTTITNPPLPPHSGFALLPSRRLISLSGPDASHFLQGVITSNIGPTTPRTSGFYSTFLNATGRVLYDVFIYPHTMNSAKPGEGWLIEVDTNEAERLFKHVKRYKLRAKFDLRLLEVGEMGVWSTWRDDVGGSGSAWTKHTIGDTAKGSASEGGDIGCVDPRAPGMGTRVVLSGGKTPSVADEGVNETTEESYRIRRYLKGVAEGQGEILREAALPQESNIDFMGGVDYRKGCYVGQELTIRTHHTGVVRKRILPVMIYGEEEPEPKTLQYKPEANPELPPQETSIGRVEKRGRSAGKFLTGMGNIGLALCRLEIMTDTQVQGDMAGYKEGDEFECTWDGESGSSKTVKVKAFVPSWHLKK